LSQYIIAYDLGTGGNKSALYDLNGNCLAECFESYPTYYPNAGWHEQRPEEWWQAVVKSTRLLVTESGVDKTQIVACGISGHSLGVVPLDHSGRLLRQTVPIWSDSRATKQALAFFERFPEKEWYSITGNGFPAQLYSVFKIMWYLENDRDLVRQLHKVIGTKDYINYRLTGYIGTDFSYASGSGVYSLQEWNYEARLLSASDLPASVFPEIVPSTQVIGSLTAQAADQLGLPQSVKVVSGGVDNSCMALGARNTCEGRVYNAQGSSSWIAVTSSIPLIDERARPYVFTHVIPGLFTSAVSIFSAGTTFRWLRDQMCPDLKQRAELENTDVYDLMTAEAVKSPVGANGLLFNPHMAGGTSMSPSTSIRGAFLNIDLVHTRADMIRAAMEGIAVSLRMALDELRQMIVLNDEMLVVGGGSRSKAWQQIYADVYNTRILRSNIDQQAAALGAAACAAVGCGLWEDFHYIDEIHKIQDITDPIVANNAAYERLLPIYHQVEVYLADLGERLKALR
jgi:xylulokinase